MNVTFEFSIENITPEQTKDLLDVIEKCVEVLGLEMGGGTTWFTTMRNMEVSTGIL